jgi:asparagine synthase (glutamine-hydrolysing)
MVKTLDLRHTEVPIDPTGFLSKLTELVHYHDAPIYTISYYVHWQMMQRMHELGYRVSISGTAADEMFTGYYDHHCFYLAEAGDEAAESAWACHVKPIVRNPFLQSPERFATNPNFRDHIYLGREGFAALLRMEEPEDFFEERFTPDTLRNRLANEMFHEVVPVILHEDDLNAMYYSIENRSPFLDRPLFEFAQTIPTRLLIRDGYGKVVLRDAMQSVVPDEVLWNRRKVGFNAPVAELLRPDLPETRAWLLADSPFFDVIDKTGFARLLDASEIPNSLSKFLFNACCAKIFLERYA